MMAARAHCHYIVMKMFHLSINEANLCQRNLEILQALHVVFGLHGIVENYGEFSLDNYMTTDQLSMARNQLYHFLSVIRYEAVPLVDAFDFHDVILNSCLGRYDGDVYRHMYEWALKAPRNKSQVHETYEKYLKSLLTKTKAKL
jgi:acyl-CoA oxidase